MCMLFVCFCVYAHICGVHVCACVCLCISVCMHICVCGSVHICGIPSGMSASECFIPLYEVAGTIEVPTQTSLLL